MTSKVINITPKQAYERLNKNKNILFLDVRSCVEYKFVGHVVGSILLPWMDDPDWEVNSRFCQSVFTKLMDRADPLNTEIILICRSGNRSLEAGIELIEKGFKNVSNVDAGFEGDLDENSQRGNKNGWRYDGLPWEQC